MPGGTMLEMSSYKLKLLNILNISPDIKNIVCSGDTIEQKRESIKKWLIAVLKSTYTENPDIPSLEYILARSSITVFQQLISRRNEKLAGFSLLEYMEELLNQPNGKVSQKPAAGFFSEFEHLLKGIVGKSAIYKEKPPAFAKHKGRKAALLRSADLSRMARSSQKHMQKYDCGLDNDAVRRRSRNKVRILSFFKATDLEWERWKWHLSNIIRDARTLKQMVRLSDEEYEAITLARQHKIPFGITPYYLSLIDFDSDGMRDRAVRAQVIPSRHYVEKLAASKERRDHSGDFMLESDTSPIDGITRRYPNIVILKPVLTCPQICVYCQRNWEIEDVYSHQAVLSKEKLENALQWIRKTEEINEVLITGGDPLLLSNKRLESMVSRLAAIPHVVRIRIGTRTPVTLPQRITESLVRNLARFHSPGKRELIIVTHFEHPYEITPQSMEAVQKFRRQGLEVYNQQVFTYFNSRKFESCLLRQKLRLIGVTPYYTFNTKGKEETDDFRVPIVRLIQEQKEEARLMPGTVRTDEIVFNVPGLGKNYLKAIQHHDLISILPDGKRLYEFHPWEKKLSLADTYLYKDVSIHDYLQRLKTDGEDIAEYKTIWYYY
jgi:lysine 2,3-aminomutase